MVRRMSALVGCLSVILTIGVATSANAATAVPAASDTSWRTDIPAAAKAVGASPRLSVWYENGGEYFVGLTKVAAGDAKALTARLGHTVHVYQQDRFASAVKRTKVNGPASVSHVNARPKTSSTVSPLDITKGNYPPFIDSTPYWGGDRIASYQTINGVNYVVECTVTAQYGTGMMTAGHCGGSSWYQGYYNGSTIVESGTMGSVAKRFWGNNEIDSEILTGGSYDHDVWALPSGNGALIALSVKGPATGTSVCTDGSTTGYICGATITSNDVCSNVNDNGTIVTVCGLNIAQNNNAVIVQPGDSGGPVLTYVSLTTSTSGSTYIAGTISASGNNGHEVLYTDVYRQISNFGVSP